MKRIGILIIALCLFVACKAKQEVTVISGNYNYDAECVSTNKDGSILVRSWGQGIDQKEAELNARRDRSRKLCG